MRLITQEVLDFHAAEGDLEESMALCEPEGEEEDSDTCEEASR